MSALYFLLVCYYTFTVFSVYNSITAYTLAPFKPLIDGHNLTSQGGTFQLGFFSPSTSSMKRYLGIWYNNIPVQTVVWVANRDSPLYDTSGVLKIGSSGNLVIVTNQTEDVIWSSNTSKAVGSPLVEFLESGNLVLRENGSNSYLWQSFDYPGDTLLPGMKQGWNLKTGKNRVMTSWKTFDDPSLGDYTYGLELGGSPEFIIRKGLDIFYRAGSWNGLQASGSPELHPNVKFTYEFVDDAENLYYMYHVVDKSKVRMLLTQTSTEGSVQFISWVDKTNSWIVQLQIPRDRCDAYALCGPYSTCDVSSIEVCQCLTGFKPKSLDDWDHFDWSLGCEREVPVQCGKGEGFKKYEEVKLPEAIKGGWVNKSMNLEECKAKCLNNCSCRAYTNSDISQGGSGCILWFVDPIDMRTLKGVKQVLYVRVAASELEEKVKRKGHLILIVSIPTAVLVGAIALGFFCIWNKRSKQGVYKKDDIELPELPTYRTGDDNELPIYDLVTIKNATNNFSLQNKLGEGGFGPVYKGILNEREVAVKRLSDNSIQGVNEFKNEVTLISKIQHRNLVRILGYCIQQDEKLLIYEYMQNNSLDTFIFDGREGRALNWQKRSDIILGIARGLLYLHHDSVLRIIHRDLKASNILLDSEMVAKISDFGLSRIFEGNQTEARTKRVVGTRGYMSPEYAVDGHFSVKSDVFSFGVLVLEIISGKRNRGFSHPDHELNLLGHAWRLWNEDRTMELADEFMNSHCFIEEISRCIHIGLLCVQKSVAQRPTMSSVLLMLSSETTTLPRPQHPGFYIERSTMTEGQSSSYSEVEAHNSMCAEITMLQAR